MKMFESTDSFQGTGLGSVDHAVSGAAEEGPGVISALDGTSWNRYELESSGWLEVDARGWNPSCKGAVDGSSAYGDVGDIGYVLGCTTLSVCVRTRPAPGRLIGRLF